MGFAGFHVLAMLLANSMWEKTGFMRGAGSRQGQSRTCRCYLILPEPGHSHQIGQRVFFFWRQQFAHDFLMLLADNFHLGGECPALSAQGAGLRL